MIRLRRKTKAVLLENKSSWSKDAKKAWIGGDHPIVVQSMTTTDTADVDKTLEQVYGLAMAGCEVVRVTCQDVRDAAGLPAIVARSPVPIVADVHFDHKMALAAIEAGVAQRRLNPGTNPHPGTRPRPLPPRPTATSRSSKTSATPTSSSRSRRTTP